MQTARRSDSFTDPRHTADEAAAAAVEAMDGTISQLLPSAGTALVSGEPMYGESGSTSCSGSGSQPTGCWSQASTGTGRGGEGTTRRAEAAGEPTHVGKVTLDISDADVSDISDNITLYISESRATTVHGGPVRIDLAIYQISL